MKCSGTLHYKSFRYPWLQRLRPPFTMNDPGTLGCKVSEWFLVEGTRILYSQGYPEELLSRVPEGYPGILQPRVPGWFFGEGYSGTSQSRVIGEGHLQARVPGWFKGKGARALRSRGYPEPSQPIGTRMSWPKHFWEGVPGTRMKIWYLVVGSRKKKTIPSPPAEIWESNLKFSYDLELLFGESN